MTITIRLVLLCREIVMWHEPQKNVKSPMVVLVLLNICRLSNFPTTSRILQRQIVHCRKYTYGAYRAASEGEVLRGPKRHNVSCLERKLMVMQGR